MSTRRDKNTEEYIWKTTTRLRKQIARWNLNEKFDIRQARDCRCQTLHQLSNKSTNRCGTYGTNVKLSLNFHGFCEFGVCTFCKLQLYQMFQRMNSLNSRYVPRV